MGQTGRAGPLTSLGIAVLALLAERPMHPYEMYQLLIERQGDRLVKVRPGSLYHTVARLVEQRMARSAGTDREGNRPERTVYEITDDGRDALRARCAELIGTPIREYPNFPVALAEAHNLPAAEVIALLRQRIGLLDEETTEIDGLLRHAAERRVPRRYVVAGEYGRAMLAAESAWLDSLVVDIAGGELAWQDLGEEPCLPDRPEAI